MRNFSIINLFLLIIAALMGNFIMLPMLNISPLSLLPTVNQPSGEQVKRLTENQASFESPSDYVVVSEINLFHPDRRIPAEKKEEKPLPKPDLVLHGTLITEELSLAYLEDLKALRTTPGRGRRQIPMRKGDILSGFVISEIDIGKVVLLRGEERMTVLMSDSHKSKKKTALEASANQTAAKSPPVEARRPAALPPKGQTASPGPQVREKDRKVFDMLKSINQ
jgi:hypothetical protein